MREAASETKRADPVAYIHKPDVKCFRTVRDLVFDEIPANPDHPKFRQGKTLDGAHPHWRRATFHARFRLFFRFHGASRTIIYAWLNDESTLRKAGSQTDPCTVFHRMLERGTPPSDWNALMRESEATSEVSADR
jgi:toxin YhaV